VKRIKTALLLLTAALPACATAPQPSMGPWGYDLTLGRVVDARTPTPDSMMTEEYPFSTQSFMTSWHNLVARTPVMSVPGSLNILLKNYEATHSDSAFSISMNVVLQARTPNGAVITTKELSCSAVEFEKWTTWGDFAQQVLTQESLTPLTRTAREATMWQKVMTSCVRDLAIPFGNALSNGASS
jgi:hypothetical protein